MSPEPFTRTIRHPYVEQNAETHGQLQPTLLRYPAYSAAAVPYRWMLKRNDEPEKKSATYDLGYDKTKEPSMGWDDNWIQERDNQLAMLDCFFGHVKPEVSLCVFYAKQVPFYEQNGRVVVGVGLVKHISEPVEYETNDRRKLRAMAWEHMVQHSIRPDGTEGFLLPYHDAIQYSLEKDPSFDPAELAVIAPADRMVEFSYGSEHVSHDAAIRVLLDCELSIAKAKKIGIGRDHDAIRQWIHDQVARIQKLRGDYPGMGAALQAFGISKGHYVAAELTARATGDVDPWELFERVINGAPGILSPTIAGLIPEQSKKLYLLLSKATDTSRIDLLHLISRFEVSGDQAKQLYVQEERAAAKVNVSDAELLEDPYRFYTATRGTLYPVHLATIDLGMFRTEGNKPLRPVCTKPTDALDDRRIRAFTVQQLEAGTLRGHTLLPRDELVRQIRSLPITPECPINGDYYLLVEDSFTGLVEKRGMNDGSPAYQLTRLHQCGEVIRQAVDQRLKAPRIRTAINWETLLVEKLERSGEPAKDEDEARARQEKVAALRELAAARFSVLIGPAGTGKTTLLSVLAGQDEIRKDGVLLLAPTGKARVRMESMAKELGIPAKTVAQFLNGLNRYDGETQTYHFSSERCQDYATVIVDEASMFTEEMLAVLLDAFKGVKRFILVGDHRQLPPIGSGRPFVDIIQRLRPDEEEQIFPRIGPGFAELTIKRRAIGRNRSDLQLAEWFSGEPLSPGEDKVFQDIASGSLTEQLRFVQWKNESDLEDKLNAVLVEELGLSGLDDQPGFDRSLGANANNFFNRGEAVMRIEDWQLLSPLRARKVGALALNRALHRRFRAERLKYVTGRQVKLPSPLGSEQITYGDKVINLRNHGRAGKQVFPPDGLGYLANGEIGIVIGQWRRRTDTYKGKPRYTEVEFASQQGYQYTFQLRDFREETDPALELAYAITVHKSQGSQFKKVFLILPDPCFVLSRELLYTALTRQEDKIILLYQGPAENLKTYASPRKSDTQSRITNLFRAPSLWQVEEGRFLEEHLIHKALDGTLLRSKSELAIYELLVQKGLDPIYEQELRLGQVPRLPDFTIAHPATGEPYYWEHCGMLHDRSYEQRWLEKLDWYRSHGIVPLEEGQGESGTLIVSRDEPREVNGSIRGAFDTQAIAALIHRAFGR